MKISLAGSLLGVLAALLVLGSCTTIDMFTYEDGNIYAELETNDPARVTLTVDNHSAGDLTLVQNRALHTGSGRRSSLTLLDEAQGTQFQLSRGDKRSLSFAPAEAISLSGGKQKIAAWVPEDASNDRFEFAYSIAGEEHPLVFPDGQERLLLGKVNVSLDIPIPFSSSVMERRRKIYDLAIKQANSAFGGAGKKLRLVNIHYDGTSNGFKEKATLTADVIAAE